MTDNSEVKIVVELVEEDTQFSLKLNFDEPIYLSLTSSNSSNLKDFFVELMNKLMKYRFILDFPSEDTDIYSNISRSYITHLNTEISSIVDEIPVKK